MLASVVGGRCNLSAVLPADPPAVGLRGQRSRPGRGVRVARPQVLLETFPPCPLAPQLACASTRRCRSGSYTSPLIQRTCNSTASFRATAITARFLAFLPPRVAIRSPCRRRSQSGPRGEIAAGERSPLVSPQRPRRHGRQLGIGRITGKETGAVGDRPLRREGLGRMAVIAAAVGGEIGSSLQVARAALRLRSGRATLARRDAKRSENAEHDRARRASDGPAECHIVPPGVG